MSRRCRVCYVPLLSRARTTSSSLSSNAAGCGVLFASVEGLPRWCCESCDLDICEPCCGRTDSVTPPVNSGGLKLGADVLFCSTHLYEHFPSQPDFDFFPGEHGRGLCLGRVLSEGTCMFGARD